MPNASNSSESWALAERSLAYVPGSAVAGADVTELQGLLCGLGYQLPDDGIYGLETADQVRQFQVHRRLGVDGVFGPGDLPRTLARPRSGDPTGQTALFA